MIRNNIYINNDGFTLVELAMVLLIIGLLLGGLLMPLATQVEQRDRRTVQQQLEEIKSALLGYAVINGSLPCPSFETDPGSGNYGIPVGQGDSKCGEEGILPWKVLGVTETDPWGSPRRSSGDEWLGYWRYRVDQKFTDDLYIDDSDIDSSFHSANNNSDELVVYRDLDQDGNYDVGDDPKLTASPPNTPILIVYSTGPDGRPSGGNTDSALGVGGSPTDKNYEGGIPHPDFDDIVVWMTRPVLLSTMLSARVLPD